MGIDYLVCGQCGEAFPDVIDYGICGGCEQVFCEGCIDEVREKYGVLGEDHEDAGIFGEDAPLKCIECTKPTLDTAKFDALMYRLIKDASRISFADFLENAGLTEEDYAGISEYIRYTYGIKTYL